jgi:hypothetical protein
MASEEVFGSDVFNAKMFQKLDDDDEADDRNHVMTYAAGFVISLLQNVVEDAADDVVDITCESYDDEDDFMHQPLGPSKATATLIAELTQSEPSTTEVSSRCSSAGFDRQVTEVSESFDDEVLSLVSDDDFPEDRYIDAAKSYVEAIIEASSPVHLEVTCSAQEEDDDDDCVMEYQADELDVFFEDLHATEDFAFDYVCGLIDKGISLVAEKSSCEVSASAELVGTDIPSTATIAPLCPEVENVDATVDIQTSPEDSLPSVVKADSAPDPTPKMRPFVPTLCLNVPAVVDSSLPTTTTRSKRRVIGGVSRRAVALGEHVESTLPSQAMSSRSKSTPSLAGAAGTSLRSLLSKGTAGPVSAMALDLGNDVPRASSLARSYDALGGAQFFRMDADSREGSRAGSRANSPAFSFSNPTSSLQFADKQLKINNLGSSLKAAPTFTVSLGKSTSTGSLLGSTYSQKAEGLRLPALNAGRHPISAMPALSAARPWSRSASTRQLGVADWSF